MSTLKYAPPPKKLRIVHPPSLEGDRNVSPPPTTQEDGRGEAVSRALFSRVTPAFTACRPRMTQKYQSGQLLRWPLPTSCDDSIIAYRVVDFVVLITI
jgi:hypothetical protein